MSQIAGTGTKDPEDEPVAQPQPQPQEVVPNPKGSESVVTVSGEEQEVVVVAEEKEKPPLDYHPVPMEEDSVNPATVFCIRLKQPKSNLLHKMSVPEICRNFRYLHFGRRKKKFVDFFSSSNSCIC